MRMGLLHIGQPLSMDATVSAHVAQKRLSCLLIVSNINGSPYSQAVLHFQVLHFLVLHFQRPLETMCESRLRWGTFIPNLGTLGLWVLELFAMYVTDG